MARPDQLLLMVLVYGTGVAAAVARGATVDPATAVVGYLVFCPLAASVHYANEYADYWTDLLADRTPFSGGSGALARTGLPRGLALRAALGSLLVGTVAVAAAWAAGVVATGTVALLAAIVGLGWGYSLPPALARRGLGEVDNALLGGVLLPVYGASVASGVVRPAVAWIFLPFGCVVFVNLLATTWPDRGPDAAVGKRTLATRLSPRTLRRLYWIGALAAAASLASLFGAVPTVAWAASAVALCPLAWAGRRYTRRRSPFPTVAVMVAFAGVQFVAWGVVAVDPPVEFALALGPGPGPGASFGPDVGAGFAPGLW